MVSLHDIPVFTVKLIPIPTPHKEAETLRVRLRCVCGINQTQRRTSSLRYCIKVCVQSINTCSRFSIFLFTVSYSFLTTFAGNLYAWQEVDAFSVPQSYASLSVNVEMLAFLPLFIQMGRKAVTQKVPSDIHWPLDNPKQKQAVSRRSKSRSESRSQPAGSSGMAADGIHPDGHSEGDEPPPDQEQIPHTHLHQGAFCYAPQCNGRRCQCPDCRDESNVVVRPKRSLAEPRVSGETKKTKFHRTRERSDNIIDILKRRQTTGQQLSLSGLTPLIYRRKENTDLAEPEEIDLGTSVDEAIMDVVSITSGTILVLTRVSFQDQPSRNFIIRIFSKQQGLWVLEDSWTFQETYLTIHVLSNGKILASYPDGYTLIGRNYLNHWETTAFHKPVPFLITVQARFIPWETFNIIEELDDKEISQFYSPGEKTVITTFIDSDGSLVVITVTPIMESPEPHEADYLRKRLLFPRITSYVMARWINTEGEWKQEKLFQISCKIKDVIFIEKHLIAVILQHRSQDYYLWSESHQELINANPGSRAPQFQTANNLVFQNRGEELITVWEPVSGIWRSRQLRVGSGSHYYLYTQEVATRLSCGIYVVLDNNRRILRVFAEVDGQWLSTTLYQDDASIYRGRYGSILGVSEISHGRIAVWLANNKILIWDLQT